MYGSAACASLSMPRCLAYITLAPATTPSATRVREPRARFGELTTTKFGKYRNYNSYHVCGRDRGPAGPPVLKLSLK
jgi:hypothetical protein